MINGTSTISTNRLQQHVLSAMIKAADLGNPEKVKAIIHLVIVMFTHTLNTLHRHWVRKPKNPIDHHHLQMLTIIFAECDQKSWQETAYQIATSMLINHALVLFFIFPTPFPSSPPLHYHHHHPLVQKQPDEKSWHHCNQCGREGLVQVQVHQQPC